MRVGLVLLSALALFACSGEEFASQATGGGAGSGGLAGAGGASGGAAGTTGGAGGAGGVAGAGATGGGGGLPACSGGVCAPGTPGGWTGPVAIIDASSDTAPQCPASYPNEELVLHDELANVPPAKCSCGCNTTGVSCSNYRIEAYAAATGCTGQQCCSGTACTTVALQNGVCTGAGSALCAAVTHAAIRADVTKPCEAQTKTSLDNLSFSRTVRVCGPATSTGCAGGACVPSPGAPTSGKVCIYRNGDEACPNGWAQKILVFQQQDNRSCSTNNCTCTAPQCGTLQAYGGPGCTGANMGAPSVPMACAQSFTGSVVQSVKLSTAPPSCTPNGAPIPGGELQQNEITICCAD